MARPAFDPSEYARTLERVSQGQVQGDINQTPAFDPKLRKEYVEAAIAGRKIEDYRPALEHMGFKFYPPERLRRYDNGHGHTEGEWRNEGMRMAFTDPEILGGFPTPEEFVAWVEEQKTKRRMRAAGLTYSKHMPKRRRR